MCGRYVPPPPRAMDRIWHFDRKLDRGSSTPLYNVAPTRPVPIVRRADDGALELCSARWGMIPPWWKLPSPPSLTFNARSEEARSKPTWRQSLRTQRCLMPAQGWYEWNEHEQVRNERGREVHQPYYIQSIDSDLIAFAALWAVWQPPEGEPVLSCALLSKQAAPLIAGIHHRMPVVLQARDYEHWLAAATPPAEVDAMIAAACTGFAGHRVSTRVNNARNDGPELIKAIAATA